ncbi:GyrI-like domain-containing protein [Frigidibacter sp. MR17.14]|uniref:AraC family transcriptional regulator n=1 Tax=Frigidibacter sp. MR17.14 TaxID=3126509 RepID=UPI003012A1D1
MTYPVEIRSCPALRLAGLLNIGPYSGLGAAYERLSRLVGDRRLWPRVQGAASIGHDNPRRTAPEALRAHACFIVTEVAGIAPPLDEIRYPAGRRAVLLLTGPYDGLPEAYRFLMDRWLPASGERMAGPMPFEIYLDAPGTRPEAALRTEIHLPLA